MTSTTRMQSGIIVGLCALIALTALSVLQGSTTIPLRAVGDAFLLWFYQGESHLGPVYSIVIDLRLPRALLAMMVGAGLGIVGVLLQTTTRNDLADPFLFGLSAGAAAGAVAVITIGSNLLGIWTLPAAAFIGGMTASALVIALVRQMSDSGPEKLILAGLAVSFIFTALTNYLIFSGDQRAAHSVLFWSLGGLGLARWDNLWLAFLGFIAVFGYALYHHRNFDALLAGEQTAYTLGVDPIKLRNLTFVICAFSTAIFVSLTGIIGFIGLMVPHIARTLTGALHKKLILLSALLGSLILLGSDLIARIILTPQELPLGIVTTSVGGLFVFFLLTKSSR
ncbi:iron ABC transporter permease [Vibrio europaeus]|uniref:FecCD family ABC transporter permease n=1 Tax=Vibrio europaeus TaxID=300876 RepID=UPI00233E9FD8|nr:iron ABC transporter permease [Vibrio europaeus]MDC5870305.1 iron ABC transporter permease [Vibrio europaeus]